MSQDGKKTGFKICPPSQLRKPKNWLALWTKEPMAPQKLSNVVHLPNSTQYLKYFSGDQSTPFHNTCSGNQ